MKSSVILTTLPVSLHLLLTSGTIDKLFPMICWLHEISILTFGEASNSISIVSSSQALRVANWESLVKSGKGVTLNSPDFSSLTKLPLPSKHPFGVVVSIVKVTKFCSIKPSPLTSIALGVPSIVIDEPESFAITPDGFWDDVVVLPTSCTLQLTTAFATPGE